MHMVNSAWSVHASDVFVFFFCNSLIFEMQILVTHLGMYYTFQLMRFIKFQSLLLHSHGGFRPRSIVGESCPGETEHVGAERTPVCPSALCQMGQEFLGKRVRPAE